MSEWKETDFGRIPAHWNISSIKEETEYVTDYVANGSFASLAENVNYKNTPDYAVLIRLTDYNNGFKGNFVYVDEHAYKFLSKSKLKGGEIIISNVGAYSGTVFLAPKLGIPMTLGPNSVMMEFKDRNDFYFYWLKSPAGQFSLEGIISGSAQPKFNKTSFRAMEIPVPPVKEQKAIAEVLSSLDDKIDLLHRQNQTLEQMAETLFRQWFVEEAKEDWEETKIKDFDVIVTDYVANGSFASLAENVNYKSVPDYAILIRLTDYNNNFNSDFVYVDRKAYEFLGKSKLYGGEIIISNVGAYAGTVFKCPHLNLPMTLGPNSIVLKSNFNNYFYLLFRSSYGKYILDGIISGSAQPKFNKTAFRNIDLQYPSMQYIFDFEKTVEPYFEKIKSNQTQIRTLEKMRDTLLPKLMGGEVRVISLETHGRASQQE